MSLAVVAALSEEIAPLAKRLAGREPAPLGEALQCEVGGVDVWLMASGDGAGRARAALTPLLTTMSVDGVVGIGVAGGLTGDLAHGDLVVLERVIDALSGRSFSPPASRWLERGRAVAGVRGAIAVSAPAIAGDAAAKSKLAGLVDSTAVVDLESAAWCDVARRAGVAYVIARCVTDTHEEALPLDFERLRDETGAVNRAAVLRAALTRPRSWRALWHLRARLAEAAERLADWSLEVLAA